MKKTLLFLLFIVGVGLHAQTALTLDSCRAMALRNNKQLAIAAANRDKAYWEHEAARTNYLPKIEFMGGYMRTSKELSILSDDQKSSLNNLGTNIATPLGQQLNGFMGSAEFQQMAQAILQSNPDLAPLVQQLPGQMQQSLGQVAGTLNGVGQQITDAFRTDSRNITAGTVLFTQPLYMGGKIRAYDKITDYSKQLAEAKMSGASQELILEVDKAYWQIVSLASKKRLALQYRDMLQKLDDDILKMVAQGVATKANELTVSVKLNEAEMTLTKVEDGLSLSRMLLCQLCGLPIDSQPTLDAETLDDIPTDKADVTAAPEEAMANRSEIKQLQLASDIYQQKVNIERAAFLPSLALTGGYGFSNPALTHGFENRFRGMWNVGVVLKVPVWNWLEGRDKVRAAKAEALTYQYQLDEAREKIELQVNQQTFRVNEANRKYELCLRNLEKAQENLRAAQVGHKEGVVTTSDLLAAQTAWLSAMSDKTDAQVDIQLTRATLNNILGK